MFFDSHAHLQLIDYVKLGSTMDAVVQAAKDNNVLAFLCVATQLDQYETLLSIQSRYPEVSLSIGLHPNEPKQIQPTVADLIQLGEHPAIVAIGETGLDYYRTTPNETWQHQRFVNHIEAAKTLQKPLIIHTRDSMDDTLAILKSEKADQVGGIMHCFSGDWQQAKQAMDLNFLISFSGIVTFKNALSLREVAQKVPLDHILIETDCPYLAPVPMRGKQNQPAFVRYTGEFLAELKKVTLSDFQQTTLQNAKRLNLISQSIKV